MIIKTHINIIQMAPIIGLIIEIIDQRDINQVIKIRKKKERVFLVIYNRI